MDNPKTISVVIMSYGYAHLVGQAIDSVLSQTRKPDRIVVVDDGAHDGVGLVARKYGVECIERETNLGIVNGFNEALFSATTDKIMFLGADNWLNPETIETLSKYDADIVSYDLYIAGEQGYEFADKLKADGKDIGYCDGYPRWHFHPGDINSANYIHGSALYSVAKAKAVGGYEEITGGNRPNEDHQLWRKMLNAGATHHHVPIPFLYYRRHEHNFLKYET